MPEQQDFQVQAEAPVTAYEGPALDTVLEAAQKRVTLMSRLKELAIGTTSENDWVLMGSGGKQVPYLQATGAEKVARLFGVVLRDVKSKRYPDGEHYVWEFTGEFGFARSDDSIEVVGSRGSRDPFFSEFTEWVPGEGGKKIPQKRQRDVAEINERDVKQSAYSNMYVNGVTRLLGLRGLTVEMLKRAKLDPSRMPGVTYREKSDPMTAKTTAPEAEGDAHADAVELSGLIRSIVGDDLTACSDFLEEVTRFQGKDGKSVPGIRSLKGASPKRVATTLSRLKKDVESGKYQVAEGAEE